MKTMIGVAFCLAVLMVLASACNGYDSEPTPVATPTIIPEPAVVATPAPTPSPTIVATAIVTSIPLDDFIPPDPVTGIGDISEALVGGQIFQLEVARTSSERSRGLMERTSLPEDAAMLFVYQNVMYRNFWMKATLIPLDILFMDVQGVVVDVQTMQPQIGVADDALKRYPSARPARYALEMNAGLAEALGITPGAQVLFR